MERNKALLLLSGGIDSTTLLAQLKRDCYDITALSFAYDQKHSIELEFALKNGLHYNVTDHKIINLDNQIFSNSALVNGQLDLKTYNKKDNPKGQQNAYVPFRNLIFLSMALGIAESRNIKEIYIAFNKDDCINFWDCTSTFLSQINSICIGSQILIKAPFIDLSKAEVICLAKELDVDLNATISCYQPIDKDECGKCLSCLIKSKALLTN